MAQLLLNTSRISLLLCCSNTQPMIVGAGALDRVRGQRQLPVEDEIGKSSAKGATAKKQSAVVIKTVEMNELSGNLLAKVPCSWEKAVGKGHHKLTRRGLGP